MKKATDAATSEYFRNLGKKGGPARAKKLSAKRRSEIARHAAQANIARIREAAKDSGK